MDPPPLPLHVKSVNSPFEGIPEVLYQLNVKKKIQLEWNI